MVSIIIPVYNVEDYISECLDSLVGLNIDYEIICVNDGSTDKSIEKIKRYKSIFEDRLIILNKTNGGLSSARNAGILKASGDLLFFLDSDDYINRKQFELFINEVIKDKVEMGFANSRYERGGIEFPNKDSQYRSSKSKKYKDVVDGLKYGNIFFDKLHNFINTEACFMVIRKSFLITNHIEFKEGIYHEDTLFTLQCLMVAKSVKYYDYPFYIYRIRNNSIMHTQNTNIIYKKFKDKGIVARELFRFKDNLKISQTFIDSIIVDLLIVSAWQLKTKPSDIFDIISNCQKTTLRSKVRIFLYKILSSLYHQFN